MIISRTPFRISLFGGGTDYPDWYKVNQGAVISAAINKYCFITLRELPPFFPYKYRVRYYNREEASSIEEIEKFQRYNEPDCPEDWKPQRLDKKIKWWEQKQIKANKTKTSLLGLRKLIRN